MLLCSTVANGTTASVKGELVETYCWATLQLGGTAHTACGIECAKRGIPVAVYDRTSRTVYILLPGRDKSSLPAALIEQMGKQIVVQGDVFTKGGSTFLVVRDWKTN